MKIIRLAALISTFMWGSILLGQPQNLQTSTLINVSYSNVSLIGFGISQNVSINIPQSSTIQNGAGLMGPIFASSSLQYLKYTLFGSGFASKSIAVSLNTPLQSDYFLLVMKTQPVGTLPYGNSPTDHSPITLSTSPQTWLSGISYGATGSGLLDGIPFYYELQKNPSGNYGTLSGTSEQVTVLFTITE